MVILGPDQGGCGLDKYKGWSQVTQRNALLQSLRHLLHNWLFHPGVVGEKQGGDLEELEWGQASCPLGYYCPAGLVLPHTQSASLLPCHISKENGKCEQIDI